MTLIPLPLAVPLAGAAVLTLFAPLLSTRAGNAIALAFGTATTGICAYVLLLTARAGTIVYWMGDWKPETHVGIGIDFAVDRIGAGGALLAAFVVTLALLYSIEYFKDSGPLFNVLLLVFMGAACACFYTGDIFDLFVFFELSNIALFSLAAYKVRDATALDGALVFVISSSVAAFAILFALTLLEGYTGQLNMATIGQYLTVHRSEALAVGALALCAAGFFVRAAQVPFHFWFADAQSSAPSPVCAMFSAVSVEIGLYAFARVYWETFGGAFGSSEALRIGLMAFGSASAIFGCVMCFGAHHLKRLIAYLTTAHMGVVLTGIGLLTSAGLAAALLYGVTFALAAASLVFCSGTIIHRFGTGDELEIWGCGKKLPLVSATFALAALAAAGIPAVGTYAGRALLLSAAGPFGGWMSALLVFVASVTGGALLKAVGGMCLGLGDPDEDLTNARQSDRKRKKNESDQPEEQDVGWNLLLPAIVTCAAALAVPMIPQLWYGVQRACAFFIDRRNYYAMTVYGHAHGTGAAVQGLAFGESAIWGSVAFAAAIALALASLYQRRVAWLHGVAVGLARPMDRLERLHDGKIGDYVNWVAFGSAVLGGMFLLGYA
jgi:multicomponent Na+:H+ antiporter subunit D